MKINKELTAPVIEIESIICNCCGQEIDKNQFGYFDDHISVEKKWGYGSEFDGETHSFDICKSCYIKLINDFAKHPDIQ